MNAIPTRTCSGCFETFPLTTEFFHRHKGARAGLRYLCKRCYDYENRRFLRRMRQEDYNDGSPVLCLCGEPCPCGKYFCSDACKQGVVGETVRMLTTWFRRTGCHATLRTDRAKKWLDPDQDGTGYWSGSIRAMEG